MLGVSLIVSSVVVVRGVEYVKTFDNSQLDVTGSSRKVVTSDQVRWLAEFSRNTPVNGLRHGYDAIHGDLEVVWQELEGAGFGAGDVVISPVSQYAVYQEGKVEKGVPCERTVVSYDLHQTLSLNSDRVQDVSDLARDVRPFIDRGINLATQSLEYYCSGVSDLRVAWLGQAIEDAGARAQAMAASTGVQVGTLQSADSSVFQ